MCKKVIQWGYEYLTAHGYTLKSHLPETVKNSPWSYVVRFATSAGNIYLKHTPPLLALESAIIQTLHNQFHADVPTVIAQNTDLQCFLMKDAGIPLREILKQQFDAALLLKSIDQFTSLQITVADHLNVFLDMGVPDWRLEKIPDLYIKLLDQKALLSAEGVSEKELSELINLLPLVNELCRKLLGYAIKPSIVQPDFHDNNILMSKSLQKITFIDLGEIVISSPFFSLTGFLEQVKRHHGLAEKDEKYQQLVDACLKNFREFESEKRLLEAFELTRLLHFPYSVLCRGRLSIACGQDTLIKFHPWKFNIILRNFIRDCKTISIG
jgi:hypothetical protein